MLSSNVSENRIRSPGRYVCLSRAKWQHVSNTFACLNATWVEPTFTFMLFLAIVSFQSKSRLFPGCSAEASDLPGCSVESSNLFID